MSQWPTADSFFLQFPSLLHLPTDVSQNLRSISGGILTSMNFINHLTVNVKVFWIDENGKRKEYKELKPGESFHQQTYVGHPWEVCAEGGFKQSYLPVPTEANVIIDGFPVSLFCHASMSHR